MVTIEDLVAALDRLSNAIDLLIKQKNDAVRLDKLSNQLAGIQSKVNAALSNNQQ